MKQQFAQWQTKWQGLPTNDQRALTWLGLFLLAMFVVFGLFQPAKHYFDNARDVAQQSGELAEWIKSNRSKLERIQPAGGGHDVAQGTLLQRVTQAAERNKVTIKRFEPEGDGRIRLWIDEVRYQDLQPWLNTLVLQHFSIVSISIDALPEVGMVSARLTLEG